MCSATLPNETPSTFSGQGVPGSRYSLWPQPSVNFWSKHSSNFGANYLRRVQWRFSADSLCVINKKQKYMVIRGHDEVLKMELKLSCVPCFILEWWFEQTLITEMWSGQKRPLTDFHDAKQCFSENVQPYLAVVCQSAWEYIFLF